jgi:penicillin amidase
LDRRWVIGGNPVPPLAKFLDPFSGFWRSMDTGRGKPPEGIAFDGVQKNISVVYDSLAIPHIFASNDLDLYFAQGYITARQRLWQMEFLTHAAAGRVSEIVGAGPGNSIIDYDRGQRRLGMVYAAQRGLEALATDQNAMIMVEKYTEGVNAYIRTLSYKNYPFEYKLLNYKPEPWTTLKCVLLLKSMAQSLSMGDKDMEMTNALSLFGPEMVSVLYPDREDVGDPIVSKPGGWEATVNLPDSVPLALPDTLINIDKLPGANPYTGSNSWVVSGSKTVTGSPMLAGDPHLDLSLPSLWYVVQLQAPGINALGASLPGLPGIIIGCTDSIAWSETNAQRDVVDWYRITFQDSTRNKYLLDDEWVDTKKVVELFKVRSSPAVYDTIVYTNWGPVPYDRHYRSSDDKKHYAFRWMGHDPTSDILGIYKLNRATNYKTFTDAIINVACPAQNIHYADVAGNIAVHVQGRFPVRRPLEGKFILDGSKRSSGWNAFIPDIDAVVSKNSPRGFESSANQYPVDETYPYYITSTQFEAYRNRRINRLLGELTKIQPEDMMKLQSDNYNLKAEEVLPLLLSALDSTTLTAAEKNGRNILAKWDYYYNVDSQGASFFEAWWNTIMALTWDEMQDEAVSLDRPTSYTTVKLLREHPDFEFFDVKATPERETSAEVIKSAFSHAVENISKWQVAHENRHPAWGDYKDSFIRHLLRIEPLGIHVKGGGNHDTINALTRTHGPSWRMVVSLERTGVKMWGVYPGGQSGNPGSAYYNNMTAAWLKGDYFPMKLMKVPEEGTATMLYRIDIHPTQ